MTASGELNRVFDQRLSLATMSTLESFLVIFLREKLPASSSLPDSLVPCSLTELLTAARTAEIFPDPTVAVIFQMAQILCSVFPTLPNAAIPETLTPRVLAQISVMIKILVDLAVIRWSEAL